MAFLASATAVSRSHFPSTTFASGSSISPGWPIQTTLRSLFTMNAAGMPLWSAAFIQFVAIAPSSASFPSGMESLATR